MAKFFLSLLFLLSFSALKSQCRELSLNTLQSIEGARPDEKESLILGAGFDLRRDITRQGKLTKMYTKCWLNSTDHKDFFEHLLFWNVDDDTVKFAMKNETHFQTIRKTLDERHPSGIGATVVSGKMFTYYLGAEKWDGIDYFTILLARR